MSILDRALSYLDEAGTVEISKGLNDFIGDRIEYFDEGEDESLYDVYDDEDEYVEAELRNLVIEVGGVSFAFVGRGYNGVVFSFGERGEYVLKVGGTEGVILDALRDVSYVVNVFGYGEDWYVSERVVGEPCSNFGSTGDIQRKYREGIEDLAYDLFNRGWVAHDLNYGNVIDTGSGLVIVDVGSFYEVEDEEYDREELEQSLSEVL